ncbi:hypothetical protein [Bacillus sp. E(2018)]|nr:hypothetical protein [Bacillus sp. E(2018)]
MSKKSRSKRATKQGADVVSQETTMAFSKDDQQDRKREKEERNSLGGI